MSTRRCVQRQLLLKPGRVLNDILGYALGLCQQRHGLRIHYFVGMSNHYHLGLTDVSTGPHSQLASFMRDFNSLVARATNVLRGRTGNLWSGGGETYNFVNSQRQEDAKNRFVYGLGNPTQAELVPTYKDWPGLVLLPGRKGQRTYSFRRPAIFFSESAPESSQVSVDAPCLDESPVEFMSDALRRLQKLEKEVQERVKTAGRRFLGAKRVLSEDPGAVPSTYEPWRTARPQIATADRQWRLQLIENRRWFLNEYARCRDAFKQGDREVRFPRGTFKLVAYYGARTRDGPDDND